MNTPSGEYIGMTHRSEITPSAFGTIARIVVDNVRTATRLEKVGAPMAPGAKGGAFCLFLTISRARPKD